MITQQCRKSHETELAFNTCDQQHLVDADFCSLAQHGQPYCLMARVFQKPLYHPQMGCSSKKHIYLAVIVYRLQLWSLHGVLQTQALD